MLTASDCTLWVKNICHTTVYTTFWQLQWVVNDTRSSESIYWLHIKLNLKFNLKLHLKFVLKSGVKFDLNSALSLADTVKILSRLDKNCCSSTASWVGKCDFEQKTRL